MRTVPCVLQVRNNLIVQYYDTSMLDFQRNGNKTALKQNNTSPYKETLKQLDKVEELTGNFRTIREFANSYKKLYNNHSNELKKQHITAKSLGVMSKSQVRSCRKAVENMISTILLSYNKKLPKEDQQFLAFVTLTLPVQQRHTDKVLRKSLFRFIDNLSKTYGVIHYIWKAEAQKNGNIHFHLLIDKSIPKEKIQFLWNKQLNKLGYIDEYKSQFPERKSPPTTDIHGLKSVKNTVNYILKYMTKNEKEKRPIIGKLWGCSNLTKRLTYPTFYDNQNFFYHLAKLIRSKDVKCVVKDEYFSVFSGKIYEKVRSFSKTTWYEIVRHYKKIAKYTKETYQSFQKAYEDSLKSLKIEPPKTKESQNPKVIQKEFAFPKYHSGDFI